VEEEQLIADLDAKLPCIFRGLIDLCAQALHIVNSVEVTHPERMLSFCRWLAALEQVMGLPKGWLQKAYSDNLKNAAMESVQESALGVTALRFAMGLHNHYWVGTPSQLLRELENLAPNNTTYRHTEWPQSPISLSKRLKQIAALLKAQGVELAFSHGTKRQIEITYIPPESAQTIDLIEASHEIINPGTEQSVLSACTPIHNQSQEQS